MYNEQLLINKKERLKLNLSVQIGQTLEFINHMKEQYLMLPTDLNDKDFINAGPDFEYDYTSSTFYSYYDYRGIAEFTIISVNFIDRIKIIDVNRGFIKFTVDEQECFFAIRKKEYSIKTIRGFKYDSQKFTALLKDKNFKFNEVKEHLTNQLEYNHLTQKEQETYKFICFPLGKYKDSKISQCNDKGYLSWVILNMNSKKSDKLIMFCKHRLTELDSQEFDELPNNYKP